MKLIMPSPQHTNYENLYITPAFVRNVNAAGHIAVNAQDGRTIYARDNGSGEEDQSYTQNRFDGRDQGNGNGDPQVFSSPTQATYHKLCSSMQEHMPQQDFEQACQMLDELLTSTNGEGEEDDNGGSEDQEYGSTNPVIASGHGNPDMAGDSRHWTASQWAFDTARRKAARRTTEMKSLMSRFPEVAKARVV